MVHELPGLEYGIPRGIQVLESVAKNKDHRIFDTKAHTSLFGESEIVMSSDRGLTLQMNPEQPKF